MAEDARRPRRTPRPRARAPSLARRAAMRARLARLGAGTRCRRTRCSSRCSARVRANHPKADLALLERAYDVAEQAHARPDAQERRPLHHPPARGRHDPRRARHDRRRRWSPRCCTTPSRTPPTRLDAAARATSATRSPMLVDGVTKLDKVKLRRRRRRPRPSARWSSRWPATSGCWSSSSPTGCTTCAPCATSRRRSRSARPARRWRSTRRWPTGSA